MRAWLLLGALACVQCGPKVRMLPTDAPVPWHASGVDWTKPPALGTPLPFAPAAPHELVLANGVRVIVVENHRLPLVALSVLHTGAGGREDGDAPGVAGLTLALLAEGAGRRSGAELRDALDAAGAQLDTAIATDHAAMHAVTTSDGLAATLDVLASMASEPTLSDSAVSRIRRYRADQELFDRRPRIVAAQVFDRVLFGTHPYAHPASGHANEIEKLTGDDVRRFWSRAYRPDRTTVLLAGDVRTDDARRLVDHTFGRWAAQATPSTAAPALPAYTHQLAVVDTPGARQTSVLIGTRAAAAGDAQQLAGDVANAIIGGGMGARLDHQLHEQLGLTLGASASFWRGRWAGSWALAMTLATDRTHDGIRAALAIVEAARTDITADDIARARANLIAGAEQSFETAAGTTRALARIVAQGLPLDWYATYDTRLRAITIDEVRAAATWRDLSIVVVGDWTKLQTELSTLALPIVRYGRDGTVLP